MRECLHLEGKVAQQIYLKKIKSNEFVESDEVLILIREAHNMKIIHIRPNAVIFQNLTAHLLSLDARTSHLDSSPSRGSHAPNYICDKLTFLILMTLHPFGCPFIVKE